MITNKTRKNVYNLSNAIHPECRIGIVELTICAQFTLGRKDNVCFIVIYILYSSILALLTKVFVFVLIREAKKVPTCST